MFDDEKPVVIDPPQGEVVETVDNTPRFEVFSLQNNGEIFVYVDSDSLEALMGIEAKRAAYDHRFKLGMGNAGIEVYNGARPVYEGEKPAARIVGKKAFRIIFRLTASI